MRVVAGVRCLMDMSGRAGWVVVTARTTIRATHDILQNAVPRVRFPPDTATWEEEDDIPCGEVDFVGQYEAALTKRRRWTTRWKNDDLCKRSHVLSNVLLEGQGSVPWPCGDP